MSESAASLDEVSLRLFDKLAQLRSTVADSPEADRRATFLETIRTELQTMADEDADKVLGSVRDRLIQDARGREQRILELESETKNLREALDKADARTQNLVAENDRLKSAAAPAPATVPASGETLDLARKGLLRMADGEAVDSDSIGLPAPQSRMFRLMQELLRFALDYEKGVNLLLTEFKVGAGSGMDTEMRKLSREEGRECFRACLKDEPGSIQRLKEILDRNRRFVIDLNTAYAASLSGGTTKLLEEFAPQPMLDQHKRMLGFDFEEAWKEFTRVQSDTTSMSRDELWERFFREIFREKLASYI